MASKSRVIQVKTMAEFHTHVDETKEAEDTNAKGVVVDFFATWCGPCKMIAPRVDGFSTQFPNITFLKVDVDESADIATKYKVTAMPTFKLFKGRSVIESVTGAQPQQLQAAIEKLNKTLQ